MSPDFHEPALSLFDFSFVWMSLIPFTIMVALILAARRTSQHFARRQLSYLDHQKDATTKIVEQNKTYEEMIAKQYRDTNEQSERALAQSARALEIHAAALRELTAMRETLAVMAARSEQGRSSS